MKSSEKWKDIEGYEGYYQVSSLGRVKSLERKVESRGSLKIVRERILKLRKDPKGYGRVYLQKDKVREQYRIHRLVAITFIPNLKNLPQVNHIDEVKDNNSVSNLEWCNNQYNTEYSLSKYFEVLTPDGVYLEIFNMRSFCRDNNLNDSNMAQVASGKRKHHKGYRVWRL